MIQKEGFCIVDVEENAIKYEPKKEVFRVATEIFR